MGFPALDWGLPGWGKRTGIAWSLPLKVLLTSLGDSCPRRFLTSLVPFIWAVVGIKVFILVRLWLFLWMQFSVI